VVVDVLGLLIGIIAHSAAIQDRDGAKLLLLRVCKNADGSERLPQMKVIFADGGYTGQLIDWVEQETHWRLEIVKRSELHTFKVLPKRWIVERTFGWLMFWRILNRHHERKHDTAENIMRIAMIRNMLRFLTRKAQPAKNKKAA